MAQYYNDGTTWKMDFDSIGNLERWETFNENRNLAKEKINLYDSLGNITKTFSYINDESIDLKDEFFEYQYDEQGTIQKQILIYQKKILRVGL